MGVRYLLPDNSIVTAIVLKNVKFFNNTNPAPNAGIVQVDKRISLRIEDSCEFESNYGSPLQVFATYLNVSGIIILKNNHAYQGGAISLSYSMLRLQSITRTNTSIILVNNTATNVGGGIFIDQFISIDATDT